MLSDQQPVPEEGGVLYKTIKTFIVCVNTEIYNRTILITESPPFIVTIAATILMMMVMTTTVMMNDDWTNNECLQGRNECRLHLWCR